MDSLLASFGLDVAAQQGTVACGSGAGCACAPGAVTLREGSVVACVECGVILDRTIDERPEWRDSFGSSDKSRVGAPESVGVPLGTATSRSATYRLPRHVQTASLQCLGLPASQRSLLSAFDQITCRCKAAQIPQAVISDAHALFRLASASKVSRKTRRVNLMAASVQEACLRHSAARGAKEIAAMFDIKPSALSLGARHFRSVMVLDEYAGESSRTSASNAPPRATDFVGRFCSKLGLDGRVAARVSDLAALAQTHVPGPAPQSLAAACIVALLPNIDARAAAQACGMCHVTLSRVLPRVLSCMHCFRP
jgi:transcription initiation factor TFIIIB Brf1 subunit/transcription initiation factor TFIIB